MLVKRNEVKAKNNPANKSTRIILDYSNYVFVIILFKKYNRNYTEKKKGSINGSFIINLL